MSTIYEVSKLAGVSSATVSRVMNDSSRVSPKTRDKVLKAMEELGFRPNSIAQSLASKRSNSIGVVISELQGSYYGMLLNEIEITLRNAKKHVMIAAGHADAAIEEDSIEFLLQRNCDALILFVEAVSDQYLRDLKKRGVLFTLINRQVEGLQTQCISIDNYQGGYLACQKMIDAGHTSIAYISGPDWKLDAMERLRGHRQALLDNGLTFADELYYLGDYSEQSGEQGLAHIHKSGVEFTGVICGNDEMAAGAIVTARSLGITMPQQLSIIGFDDAYFSRFIYPRLTTIKNPIKEIGAVSANRVLNSTYGLKSKNLEYDNKPVLIERDSLTTPQA
ncbi:LacI family DNA-binding transcriptional regulator [Thalassotalea sp. PS06]|uniref:LacI family DNA-binding transcriptional regulator n=1 Tax=Thalassotalea sp. PS06 TaxID=2594005 RepID=UPI001161F826|nr:LacI family DNA-binding transcriptional regulator [Thalassotalea sp. PS06]QDP00458.1 LacI family transcriptional regulator [Thalassotalea sp. PS06]